MVLFGGWTPADEPPAVLHDATELSFWDHFIAFYSRGRGNQPLERIAELAREHSVRSVVIEPRYIDVDWRSEHSEFYSTTFRRYASVCHRAHFFTGPVDPEFHSFSQDEYIGYTILRPLPSMPVSRTMIKPPPPLSASTACAGAETVDLLGHPLAIEAMPFISQDGQYLRCAHAAIWMALQLSHLRGATPRRIPEEIHECSTGGVVINRQIPSEGLTVHQMLAGMNKLGLSPAQLPLPLDRSASEQADYLGLYDIMCRHINSNLPPIVISNNHAWLVVAYQWSKSSGHDRLTLFRHDDAKGPYIRVDNPWQEQSPSHQPWKAALLPLPPKIYMTAERAELIGRWWFQQHIASDPSSPLAEAESRNELRYRVYGLRGRDYKQGLKLRPNLDPLLAHQYRLAVWPRNIWVVEALDRSRRENGEPPVLGEVILDPTANHEPTADDPGILSTHANGHLEWVTPDCALARSATVGSAPYESGCAALNGEL
ncbi:hypothetical protein [Candidatus Poriferisocius sp.]|uniref:hypothetical protein n=1 Tax=Candidatus Poriferisocius sp. TaxID=3101276 RepID=UPI003B5BFE90